MASESCCSTHEHNTAHSTATNEKAPHVFTRGDLLRNYQTLERLAAFMPLELLEQSPVDQMDALVGQFEQLLSQRHSSHTCHHSHNHTEENDGHDHCSHEHADEDVDPWEEELKNDLAMLEYRRDILKSYTPLHPTVYKFESWPLEPCFKELVFSHTYHQVLPEDVVPVNYSEKTPLIRLMPLKSTSTNHNDPEFESKLRELVREVSPGVFVFDLLPADFCVKLLEEIHHFESWCEKTGKTIHRPNSMNNYGAILDDFGFEPCLEQMVSQVMNVISSVLFPHIGPTLDHHHGFLVEYEMGKDQELSLHVDDSDVTLNVCLGEDFSNGELLFEGVRCNHHQSTTHPLPGEQCVIEHKLGQACVHVGRHRHSAMPISRGKRCNLILWCRSSKFRRLDTLMDCPDWCPISAILDSEASQ